VLEIIQSGQQGEDWKAGETDAGAARLQANVCVTGVPEGGKSCMLKKYLKK
jgi:hypothetical protein